MRTRTLFAFVVGIVAITALAACSGGGGLTGKTWQLTAITEKVPAFQGVVPAADQPNYTITFEPNGTFSAKADCNQLSGSYTTTGSNGLTIVPGPMTLAACPPESLSSQYVEALGKAATYEVASGQLTITLSDEGTLVYK
jgi:heat shock protein HslJ